MRTHRTVFLCLLASLALLLGGCATEPNLYTGKTGYFGYTWDQELKLGAQSDASIVKEMGVYQDDELSRYIRDLGNTLLEQSAIGSEDAPEIYRDTEFTFRLLDSPVVNAFALPGGYVYVTRGLLAHLENEAQLAVVIGHEITHVEARHASKQALTQQLGQIGLLAGAVIGEQIAENKQLARDMVSLSGDLFQVAFLKYGRDAERESDEHGVEYAAKAGYAAAEGSAFFRSLDRISDRAGQTIPSWMSSHPDPGEREKTIPKLAANWDQGRAGPAIIGRERFLEKIDGLIVGENPRNGYTADGRFYLPSMKLQFDIPNGWILQNESSAVYLTDPDRMAMVAFSVASQSSPLEAARALQNRLSIEPSYAQDTQLNGFPAYQLEGSITSESGTLMLSATFVRFEEKVFTFLAYGRADTFPSYQRIALSIPASFTEVTNPRVLNVQPYRIEVAPAERSAPFSSLLPSRLPSGTDAEDWAIMNQVELDERIERGRLIKLPNQN